MFQRRKRNDSADHGNQEAKGASAVNPDNGPNRGNQEARNILASDPDIAKEFKTLQLSAPHPVQGLDIDPAKCPFLKKRLPLTVIDGSHRSTVETARLVQSVGSEAIHRMTAFFYTNVFADAHLNQFFRDVSDPHAERLANWIIEKMNAGNPLWSNERRSRPQTVVMLAGGHTHVVHDRSSAHVAAWYSPRREPQDVGQHFKVDDCRVWMRLMFYAARETGLFQNQAFADWYVRFIGHFVKVYERAAPQFARESARWSEQPNNVLQYQENGRLMSSIIGIPLAQAVSQLPTNERHGLSSWPYEL